MQELIKELQDKAGLTEDQAKKSLKVLMDYIDGKIPPMMRPMVAKFLDKQKDEFDPLGE